MAQRSADQARIVSFAKEVLSEHGASAVGYTCDRIIESMGGDPVVEDMWHDVLDLLYRFEESGVWEIEELSAVVLTKHPAGKALH